MNSSQRNIFRRLCLTIKISAESTVDFTAVDGTFAVKSSSAVGNGMSRAAMH